LPILDEYITVKEMVAIEMNSEYLGVSTQLMMENARSQKDSQRQAK